MSEFGFIQVGSSSPENVSLDSKHDQCVIFTNVRGASDGELSGGGLAATE